ncbi:MAG TPA: YkgJ family cysteine cluster protein, partial [Planctomycetota bacterium]|nr:YkgJ family cysteine cluster protein [Planctomycetota bacterium]
HDTLLDREVRVGPVSAALLERLDGSRSVPRVVDEVVALEPARTRTTVETSLRSLLLLNLVEGAGDGIREKIRAQRASKDHPLRALPMARFACQGIGDCCQSYLLGPLMKADVARLEKLDIRGKLPQVGEAPYLEEIELEGKRETFLKRVEDRCVFLLEDGRCGIHAHFGFREKPFVCRVFPYTVVLTFEGIRVADMGECSTFAVSSQSGEAATEIAGQLLETLEGQLVLVHPTVQLGALPCDSGHFAPVTDALIELASRGSGVGPTLAAVGELLQGFVEALEACPLEAGEPDATVSRFVERVRAFPVVAPRATREDHEALAVLASALLGAILPSVRSAKVLARGVLSAGQQRELSELLFLLRAVATRSALDPYHMRALQVPLGPEVQAALELSIRQQIFAGRIFIKDHVRAGVLRLSLALALSVLGGKLRALAQGATQVRPLDLSWAHHLAQRGLRTPRNDEILVQQAALAWEACRSAASIVQGVDVGP